MPKVLADNGVTTIQLAIRAIEGRQTKIMQHTLLRLAVVYLSSQGKAADICLRRVENGNSADL